MEQNNAPRFFLGANSGTGFSSLYDSFVDPAAGDFLWVIKGGPGCGKSSFMRAVGQAAERRGARVEYILCSGDPDSLDAVYLPDARIAYVDGTAPHVLEPPFPGAAGAYLDFSAFLDTAALKPHLPELTDLTHRYRALYAAAYARLAAAAALLPKNQPGVCPEEAVQTLARRCAGIAAREMHPLKKPAAVSHRFLSAHSCLGRVSLAESLQTLCPRLIALENGLGLGHIALSLLAESARARGYDAIHCHDPLEPEKLEALILPEAELAFLALDAPAAAPLRTERTLRLDTLALRALGAEERSALRQKRRESQALLSAAYDALARAKVLHDELEAIYHPHVDFGGVSALAKAHTKRLFPR